MTVTVAHPGIRVERLINRTVELMRARPENMRLGTVDQGNFIAHTDLVGRTPHREVGRAYDGAFVEDLYQKSGGAPRWVCLDAVAAYYNALA